MPFGADHFWELIPLIILALLFFGPKRLPEMGSAIGKTITEFRRSMKEVTEPAKTPPTETTAQPPQVSAPAAPATPALPATTVEATPAEPAQTRPE